METELDIAGIAKPFAIPAVDYFFFTQFTDSQGASSFLKSNTVFIMICAGLWDGYRKMLDLNGKSYIMKMWAMTALHSGSTQSIYIWLGRRRNEGFYEVSVLRKRKHQSD